MKPLTEATLDQPTLNALVAGDHTQPFAVLGIHNEAGRRIVRTYQPDADTATVLIDGSRFDMQRVHNGGLFETCVPDGTEYYRIELSRDVHRWELADAYRFGTTLGEMDFHLFNEGTHLELYKMLGAHLMTVDGEAGVRFAVWAPNARQVSVIGEFNHWDRRRHVLRHHPAAGIFEIFIPGIAEYSLYKFAIRGPDNSWLVAKSDPLARSCEAPPGNASIVYGSGYQWQDSGWFEQRAATPALDQPMSIYEVHAGSWRFKDGRSLTYREMAEDLVNYVADTGFTHIEFLPLNEHPFTGSWGYQPTGLYAPTERFGTPDDFRFLVDRAHQAGIGVIMDWVPAHFPSDAHGLAYFDGTHLYEHADPRQGVHKDWDTLIYNYGRKEVANFLLANAVYWIREFHIDGLRVDAVASMLYLNYSREDGEWIPNKEGGHENLEAVEFLQRFNSAIHAEGAITLAEESTSWGGVTKPVDLGGLGFSYKWDMGWMHDTLDYMETDPVHRRWHHQRLTFGMMYNHTENFTLPFSHDEVVYGKRSMLSKMPGDDWQARANLRALYGYMYGYAGKKLLFMGSEFGQYREWSHDSELDWWLLDREEHQGLRRYIKALNQLYRTRSALSQRDHQPGGFDWISCNDAENSVLSWYRFSDDDAMLIVCNFTPVPRPDYRIGVNEGGSYRSLLNSDSTEFGGSGVTIAENPDNILSEPVGADHKPASIRLTLPPLSCICLDLVT